MKRVLSIVLTVTLVLSLSTFTAFAGNGNGKDNGNGHKISKEFKDMKGHWGKKSVEKIQSWGIIIGYADGTFQPDKAITEAELAVIIDRLIDARLGSDDDDDESVIDDSESDTDDEELSDVPAWAKKAISKGFKKHYLNQKRFHSHVQANRLMACVAIAKALDLEPVTDFTTNPFKDRNLMGDEDYGYLLALYKGGYINGYLDGNFNPNKLITRAQIAKIIEKLLDEGVTRDDETAPTWSEDSSITAAAIRVDSVDLKWSGAADNIKVVAYKVTYKLNGTTKAKYFYDTTGKISGLEADKDYAFTVEAKDAAGNWSNDGPSVTVTTLEKPVADTAVPTWSSSAALTVSSSESGVVTIVWPDAEDNTGVTAYKIYKDSVLINILNGDANNVNVTGLAADTEYTFKVRAVDAAGNISTSLSKTYLTE